jgi:glycosyltransferase involved in cell wall biosynthesis
VRSPDISIVIPSFNQGQYIERTLLSILKQEYPGKVEVIVSDGGSADNTVDVLKKYDKQITWWSEKDAGYADAVNKGFAKATGEIFAIQSSDDFYLQNADLWKRVVIESR